MVSTQLTRKGKCLPGWLQTVCSGDLGQNNILGHRQARFPKALECWVARRIDIPKGPLGPPGWCPEHIWGQVKQRSRLGGDLRARLANLFVWEVCNHGNHFLGHVCVGQNRLQEFKTCLFLNIKFHHFLEWSGPVVSCYQVSLIEEVRNWPSEGGHVTYRIRIPC